MTVRGGCGMRVCIEGPERPNNDSLEDNWKEQKTCNY